MIHAEADTVLAERDVHYRELRSDQRTCEVTVEKALVLAHSLLQANRYEAAMRMCKVASVDSRLPEAAILLASCEVGLKEYAASQKTLQAVFSGAGELLAVHLQAAFVYHDLGMNVDAINELITLTSEAQNLPMVWLLLGDRLNDVGERDKAAYCWQLAIDHDGGHGVAATAAQRELASLRRAGGPPRRHFGRTSRTNDQS